MPRRPRLHLPGGFYHLILRGNARQAIFFDAEDRQRWEDNLQAGMQRHSHRIHAYCWMTNHVHLAVQAHAQPLGPFIADMAGHYARTTNLKMGRSGHLFERRYRAILIQETRYLRELVRYIHLNPLRAGMVTNLTNYLWSSHAAYLGAPGPAWLTVDRVLALFADRESIARQRYAEFMGQPQPGTVIKSLRQGGETDGRALGDDDWQREVLERLDTCHAPTSLDELVATICQQHRVTEVQLASSSRARRYSAIRAEIALAATARQVATVTDVARRFGRSQPGLSRAMNRLRARRQCQ